MRTRVVVTITLVPLLLAAGAGLAGLLISLKTNPPDHTTPRPPLVVRALQVAPRTLTERIAGYGTAVADRYAWLSSEVPGHVAELAEEFRAGAAVRKGQLLITLDDREYAQQLRRAQSRLDLEQAELKRLEIEKQSIAKLVAIASTELEIAQRETDRVRGMVEEGTSGRRELDLTRLEYEQSRRRLQTFKNDLAEWPQRHARQEASCRLRRAEVALAQLDVDRCQITAPFGGRLETIHVEIGERVAAGQRLASLLDPDRIEVPIELPVSRRADVRVGSACVLSLESRQDVVWRGSVSRVAPSADETNRSFRIYVEVDNRAQARPLIPGMFVHARIDGPTHVDVIAIPRGSVQDGSVFVSHDRRVQHRSVTIVRRLAEYTIVSGLDPGEIVITSNLDALSDGMQVELQLLSTPLQAINARRDANDERGLNDSRAAGGARTP